MLEGGRTVIWFSCGVTSAVAAHMALQKYKATRPCFIAYTNPGSEDQDNMRFLKDCEQWLGHKIDILRSKECKDVDEVVEKHRFLRGPRGAKCTSILKKMVRQSYVNDASDVQVFGFDAGEYDRAKRFRLNNPEVVLDTPLIDAGMTKADCKALIKSVGIVEPVSYRHGFSNANCIGCLKAEGPGYWNKVRVIYPEVFQKRAKQERELGYALCRINKKPVFLDELDPSIGEIENEPSVECGLLCADILKEEECEV